MTSSFGCFFRRATILRASSNGQALDCSATSRSEGAVSMTDIMGSGTAPYLRAGSGQVNSASALRLGRRRRRRHGFELVTENAERDRPGHILGEADVTGLGALELVGHKTAAAALGPLQELLRLVTAHDHDVLFRRDLAQQIARRLVVVIQRHLADIL